MVTRIDGKTLFRLRNRAGRLGLCLSVACATLLSANSRAAQPTATPAATPAVQQESFKTPEAACEALIRAAEQFDVPALMKILGPDGVSLVVTSDQVQDKNHSADFAAQAREKTVIVRDPEKTHVATLVIGTEDWPVPIPLVEKHGTWRFDSKAGREEILNRRIGENELDAIEVCRGYVEAQHEYASEKHDGARVNQYAQRVFSTPGTHDGLAWEAPDGSWQGPVGEGVARAIAEGYAADRYNPYHGYVFKVLKRQGPAAALGEMDYVVEGVMIGGFALIAAPAEYQVSGVKTFIVSHEGVVFEKDLGPKTLEQFRAMDSYNPDPTWTPVEDE